MHSKDIPRLKGPLHALLWEQWRMTRPVALLPLIVALADGGLWLWCHVALDMPVRQFIDLADAFVVVMLALTGLVLLSQPDRRLELRLATSPRLLRLPVRGRALLFTSLPLRVGMAALFGALSLLVHHGFYGTETDLAFWLSLEFFLCCYLLLYTVAAPMSMRGDRASMIATGLAAGLLVLVAKPTYGWTTEYPIPALLLAGAAALAGGAGMHGLRRCGGTMAATTFSVPAMAGGYSDIRDIPRFATPLEAQVWFERRRHGWLLPALSLLVAIGCGGYHLLAEQNRVINLETFYDFIAASLMLLPVAAVVVAGVIAVMDARALNGSSGRFQFVRPMSTPLLAQARLRMAVRSSGYSVLVVLGIALLLFVMFLLLAPRMFLNAMYEESYVGGELVRLLTFFISMGILYASVLLLVALVSTVVLVMGNRINVIACMAAGVILLVLGSLDSVYFEIASVFVLAGALLAAMLGNAVVSWRTGLSPWWPVIPGMLLLPLLSSPYGLVYTLNEVIPNFLGIAAFVLPALALSSLVGLPLGFHLRRSQSWLPSVLDTARPNLMELRRACSRIALIALLLAGVYAGYRVGMMRVVETARKDAELALDAMLREEHPVPAAYVSVALNAATALAKESERHREQLQMEDDVTEEAQKSSEDMEREITTRVLEAWLPKLESAWQEHGEVPVMQVAGTYDRESEKWESVAENLRDLLSAFIGSSLEAAESGDTESAARYLAQTFSVIGTMESLGVYVLSHWALAETHNRWFNSFQRVFDLADFNSEQLGMLQSRVPQRQYEALSGRWLREDMSLIQDYGDLDGERYPDTLAWKLGAFWYHALGVVSWDQLASYGVIRSEALSLQGKGKLMTQTFLPFGTPQSYRHLNQYRLRYPAALQSQARNEVLRTGIAVLRFQREHGRFPDELDELLGGYLDEIKVSPYGYFNWDALSPDYRVNTPYEVEIKIEDWRTQLGDPFEVFSASFSLTLRAR